MYIIIWAGQWFQSTPGPNLRNKFDKQRTGKQPVNQCMSDTHTSCTYGIVSHHTMPPTLFVYSRLPPNRDSPYAKLFKSY